jgi:FkbM family methyltransferase
MSGGNYLLIPRLKGERGISRKPIKVYRDRSTFFEILKTGSYSQILVNLLLDELSRYRDMTYAKSRGGGHDKSLAFIDVGSNQGLFTLSVLHKNETSPKLDFKVILVEPQKEWLENSKFNLGHFENIDFRNFALIQDNARNVELHYGLHHATGSIIPQSIYSHKTKIKLRSTSVAARNVDDFFLEIDASTDRIVLKIDIDGDDLGIALSALRLLKSRLIILVIEITLQNNRQLHDIDDFLRIFEDSHHVYLVKKDRFIKGISAVKSALTDEVGHFDLIVTYF